MTLEGGYRIVVAGLPVGRLVPVDGSTPDMVDKFGRNGEINTGSAPEDVWEGGGLYTGQPDHAAAAQPLAVASDDPADIDAGVGARTVRLYGLDENWAQQSEDVTLNGTAPVVTDGSWRRMFRVEVLTAGTSGGNVGTVTVSYVKTGVVFAVVAPGKNQTQVAAYTVPAGFSGEVINFSAQMARASGADGSAEITVRRRREGGVYNTIRNYELTQASTTPPRGNPIPLDPLDDLLVRVESVSDSGTIVTAEFDVILTEQ